MKMKLYVANDTYLADSWQVPKLEKLGFVFIATEDDESGIKGDKVTIDHNATMFNTTSDVSENSTYVHFEVQDLEALIGLVKTFESVDICTGGGVILGSDSILIYNDYIE